MDQKLLFFDLVGFDFFFSGFALDTNKAALYNTVH